MIYSFSLILYFFLEYNQTILKHTTGVSFIIPVFNEMRTVGSVIEVAQAWGPVSEVIVVNDGSTDDTAIVLRQWEKRIHIVTVKKNTGKGYAVAVGIEKATYPIVVLLDADTCGLTVQSLNRLVRPVLNGSSYMSLGAVRFFRRPWTGLDTAITGFRAIKKSLLISHTSEMKLSRYGVEWLINDVIPKENTKVVDLPYVYIIDKFMKNPNISTAATYFYEGIDIAVQAVRNRLRRVKQYGR